MKISQLLIFITVAIFVYFMFINRRTSEAYTPLQKAFSFGFVDTNPQRRVSSYFDQCSPENFSDCQKRAESQSQFEGYPLP